MEFFLIKEAGYKIIFAYSEYLLKVYIKENIEKRKEKHKFASIKISFEDNFTKFFSNFKDLINKIKNKIIFIEIKKNPSFIELSIINKGINSNKQENIISRKIYAFNVKYYLTKGIYHQRINSEPYYSVLTKDYFNKQDIQELIENDNTLNQYIIDDYRYFNDEKGVFQEIKNENILLSGQLILEFHFIQKRIF